MRTVVAAAVACLSVVGLSVAADVQASIKKDISIPAGGLGPALKTLSAERRIHFVFISEDVNRLRTEGASGSLTIDEALNQLLNGTGLTFKYIDDETVSIVPLAKVPAATPAIDPSVGSSSSSASPSEGSPAKRTGESSKGFWGRFRIAQAEAGGGRDQQVSERSTESLSAAVKIEEVIVTAQKREEKLQDVPISISVLGGAELDRSTAQGLTEALNRVPGVATTGWIQGGNSVTVRGVSSGIPVYNGASPIAYYLDTVPFGFAKSAIGPDTNAYDLNRVEVLRGPQGTLYGASAQNGVVRVLTNDADLDEFVLNARSSISSTEGGGENYRGDLAVNVPLVEDRLAVRAVVGYQDMSGWIDNPIKDNANDAEIGNYRLRLAAKPTDAFSINLSAWSSRQDYGAPSVADGNNRTLSLIDEPVSVDYDVYGMRLSYDFPAFTLASSSGYLEYSSDSTIDYIPVFTFSAPLLVNFRSEVASQELLLTSTHDGPWRWSLGGIYRDAEESLWEDIPGILAAPLHLTDRSRSFAMFGELTRAFIDGRLDVTVGFRYFEDDLASWELSDLTGAPPAGKYSNLNFDAFTPRLVLNWHADERTTIYASYAQGFRSGWSQVPAVTVAGLPPVEPDTLHNYEVGAKGSVWGGRLNYEAAVYFIDWKDVQQTLTLPLGDVTITGGVNGESASGLGLDFGADALVTDNLELGINLSWNDLSFDRDLGSSGLLLFAEGDRLNLSPEYTVGVSADYSIQFRDGYEALFSASANYTSEQDVRTIVGGTTQYIAPGDPMLIGRTSLSLISPNKWTATLFADNINNEQGSPLRQPYSGAPVPEQDLRIRPRTIGLQLDYRF